MPDPAPAPPPGWWRRWLTRRPSAPGASDSADPPAAGSLPRLGRYQATALLGRGASGPVYLAHAGDATVALKVLNLDPNARPQEQADIRQRFEYQVDMMRRLAHPDIVALVDSGESAGTPWLAMEIAPGSDLSRYTQRQRLLPEALVLRIGARIARALDHAHARGIVHRDLKPANVRLDLASGQVKLLDFGVARREDAAVTRTGVTLGTPAYMAPEQLAGDNASPASDTYALGVMLYELLTGRLPFPASSLGELLRAVSAGDPAPLGHWRPDLPQGLEAVISALLRREPRARPASLSMVADTLERWATAMPQQQAP